MGIIPYKAKSVGARRSLLPMSFQRVQTLLGWR